MIEVPLQAVDNILREFHIGHILVASLVLAVLGTVPLKSMKLLGLNVVLFGTLLLVIPLSLMGDSVFFRLMGAGLLVIGPMLYVFAEG